MNSTGHDRASREHCEGVLPDWGGLAHGPGEEGVSKGDHSRLLEM